ncbi:heparan-alpha-glucosaminide N-acetyltransferase [Peptoniphilus equinus]|uniref:Heparan-alpha-glucosaminide N-acetyltransferase n=1 Tax=Peptoniphilus equinus TaxID=3016343 RepID=A0ABY7QTE4_9FIRM|nr:heparan-alpha-glucosaminide N-acetyltransferase [Peptoniphilus equinus]WBW50059.1 heparan-alpha-glucosaminide N-acetyltransferase [Peptoniphilus equinus]
MPKKLHCSEDCAMKRNHLLDTWRGLTVIAMVLFHFAYDINLYWQLSWYDGTTFTTWWQRSIAVSFFWISGMTASFLTGEKNIKRGLKLTVLGVLITLVTTWITPDLSIYFGVLNGLGASLVVVGLLQQHLRRLPATFAVFFACLYIGTYTIPSGVAFGRELPQRLYALNLYPLGFPNSTFTSTDYFPLLPWVLLLTAGFIFGDWIKGKDYFGHYGRPNLISQIGRKSLLIYVTHQVVLYGLTELLVLIFKPV